MGGKIGDSQRRPRPDGEPQRGGRRLRLGALTQEKERRSGFARAKMQAPRAVEGQKRWIASDFQNRQRQRPGGGRLLRRPDRVLQPWRRDEGEGAGGEAEGGKARRIGQARFAESAAFADPQKRTIHGRDETGGKRQAKADKRPHVAAFLRPDLDQPVSGQAAAERGVDRRMAEGEARPLRLCFGRLVAARCRLCQILFFRTIIGSRLGFRRRTARRLQR